MLAIYHQEPFLAYVAYFLKRSEDFVKRNWKINPYESLVKEEDEQRALSQESKIVIREMLARPKKKSVRAMMKDLEKTRKKEHLYGTVYNFLRAEKAGAFHIMSQRFPPKMLRTESVFAFFTRLGRK